jgi:hypothetical protein
LAASIPTFLAKWLAHLAFGFAGRGDQAMAAEPSFHRDQSDGGRLKVTAIHRGSDHRSELSEPQTENGLPCVILLRLVVVISSLGSGA